METEELIEYIKQLIKEENRKIKDSIMQDDVEYEEGYVGACEHILSMLANE